MNLHPIVLCGGSGTRLWPLSRKSFPKQFVPLIGGKSLLQLTLERLAPLASSVGGHGVMLVAAEEHRFMAADALRAAKAGGSVILEPAARNTAAAMALAALQVLQDAGKSEADALLLFCPADHHIPDIASFASTVRHGMPAAELGAIVTFGVVPSFPSTAYGYIQQGGALANGAHGVDRFIEKPAAAAAEALLLQGGVLWNAGIFLTRASTLLQALAQHAPDILASCQTAMATAREELAQSGFQSGFRFIRPESEAFKACRSQSIDYAVMEPLALPGAQVGSAGVAVVPFAGQWSDVGSWNAVADLSAQDSNHNRIEGQGVVRGSANTFIHAPHRPVVALGTQDLLIIDTPDAVLVAHRDHAEQVKDVVSQLEAHNISQAANHRKVARPWGWYDSVDAGERFQVKRISVNPGASLSLQMHHHRAEHWIVVKGTAEVTCGSKTVLLTENQSTYIPLGETHRLANPGSIPLEIIEVQSGSYLGEDDIVRFEDNYGRLRAVAK
jgi:mannose-1-phosphate guanylyltransferase/mannose-6-phosphate isomerase